MPKGDVPEGKQRIIEKDPITGKITGSKLIDFPQDEKAEEKLEGFKLTEVESKGEEAKPVKKGRPSGIHTPISEEGRENIKQSAITRSKRKFKKEKYRDNPICALINMTSMNMINRTILSDRENKLTVEDMNKISFGEAVVYTIDYYMPTGIDVDHPMLILGVACLGLGMKVMEIRNKPPKQPEDSL